MAPKNEDILSKIKQLYRDKNNKKKLVQYVIGLSESDIKYLITANLISSQGSELLDALLLGLSNNAEGQKKLFTLIQMVLKIIREQSTPATLAKTFLTDIILEFPHLSIESLVKLIEECIETICKNSDYHTSWKDILPECIRILSVHGGNVTHCDNIMSTSEFVSQCFKTLCQARWPVEIVTPLAALFLDMPLNKEEHLQIVNKLCCYFDDFNPDSLPPLIHQLLRLCQNQNGATIYFRLNDYFYKRLYSKQLCKESLLQDSESPIMDMDLIEEFPDDQIQKAEATCIYYACRGGNAFKKFLSTLKGLTHRPSSLLLAPTLLQILLAAEHQKESCIQIIRSSLHSHFLEEFRRRDFAWCKDVLSGKINIKTIINIVIENNKTYCHITGEGLLSLAISLIATGGILPTANKLQELGPLILIKLIKNKPEAAGQALKMIRDKLGSESVNVHHIAVTLGLLSLHMPHTMMECTITIQGIIEDCVMLPEGRHWSDNKQIIESFSNLMRLDSRLRDTLVMMCRKGLFSRDTGVGRIAVYGFLSLIKTLKVNAESLTQDSSSYSVLSQISSNVHSIGAGPSLRINNSTVCMEVISLLRRCFKQSVEVREQLYLGLPIAVHKRPELLEPVFNILYEHLTSHYYVSDVEALPPLLLEKCVVIKENSVTLQEPIGRLLFVIQELLVCEQAAPGGDAPGGWSLSGAPEQFHGISGKLYGIMLSLTNRMTKCTAVNFSMDNSIVLNDISDESKTKCLTLQQSLLCCEALMAFKINEWTPTKSSQPQKVLNLQKLYNQLLDLTKNNNAKTKKDSAGKKTQKSQKSQKNKENDNNSEEINPAKGKRGRKAQTKFSDLAKKANVGFKQPTSVWNLLTLSRALELLYGDDVKWSTMDQLNQVRTKRDFHKLIIRLGISTISCLKSKRLTSQLKKQAFECGRHLYHGCISRLNEFIDFDIETSLLTAECFNELMQLIIFNSSEDFSELLTVIGNTGTSEKIDNKISTITGTLASQLEAILVNPLIDDEPIGQKIVPMLFQIITTLLTQLPAESIVCKRWIEWLQNLASKDFEDSKNLGTSIIATILNIITKSADSWSACELLVKKLSIEMGINEDEETEKAEETSMTDFAIINSSSSSAAYLAVCTHLNTEFSAIETIIGRLRADLAYLQFRKPEQAITAIATIKNRERAVCSELCRAATVVRQLAIIVCPAGPCCDSIIRVASRLHAILSTITSHFISRDQRSIHGARFDKLVKLSGKTMSQAIDALVSHVEKVREGNPSKGTKGQARVIKDTKNIPRLIYNCELFYKRIHLLSAKTKMDLVSYLSKGNARDFRIKASLVKEALKNKDSGRNDLTDNEMDISNDNEEDKNSVEEQADVEMNEEASEQEDDEGSEENDD